ncbi:uncharacterized protein LOC109811459 [Cajanus cajan]|uniref:uncharacterized protein LOC109811459 n=1 Tax=Cajanus cajan TaxID=3821 RepID=UPI00098DC256|nr:uncharacterized protein LOC109811459 [Cajanus cajan]
MPMSITEFPALVEKANVVERLESVGKPTKTVGGPTGSKSSGGSQRKSYDRPQQQGGSATRKYTERARSGAQAVRCYRCGGPHIVRDYTSAQPKGFRCSKFGHLDKDFPVGASQSRGAQRVERPRVAGRVFALTGADASTSPDLVKGKGKAAGTEVSILFDSGATHSFIYVDCVRRLGLSVSALHVDLSVSTPASVSVVMSEMCVRCPIEVFGRRFEVNLIVLPMVDIDIILRMD